MFVNLHFTGNKMKLFAIISFIILLNCKIGATLKLPLPLLKILQFSWKNLNPFGINQEIKGFSEDLADIKTHLVKLGKYTRGQKSTHPISKVLQ